MAQARRNDPPTSHSAISSNDIEGHNLTVWQMLYRMPNNRSATWDEAKKELHPMKPDSISPRFKTLVRRKYAYRIEVDKDGNEIGIITGDDVLRKKIRYKTRACIYSRGRQLVNYWKHPDQDVVWTPPPPKPVPPPKAVKPKRIK